MTIFGTLVCKICFEIWLFFMISHRSGRYNEQIEKLFILMRDCDKFKLHHTILEPAPIDISQLGMDRYLPPPSLSPPLCHSLSLSITLSPFLIHVCAHTYLWPWLLPDVGNKGRLNKGRRVPHRQVLVRGVVMPLRMLSSDCGVMT